MERLMRSLSAWLRGLRRRPGTGTASGMRPRRGDLIEVGVDLMDVDPKVVRASIEAYERHRDKLPRQKPPGGPS